MSKSPLACKIRTIRKADPARTAVTVQLGKTGRWRCNTSHPARTAVTLITLAALLLITQPLAAWSYPVGSGETIRITQPYMNYFSLMGGYHVGVDFGRVWNDPNSEDIRTIADGQVIIAQDGYNRGWGTIVVIQHPFGSGNYLFSAYSHMVDGSLQVAEGDQVTEGDTLGLMGATGNVTGKHLHFMLFSRAIGDPAWPEFSLTDLGYGYTKKPYGKVFVWEETRFYDPLDLLYTLQERNQPAPPREVADPPQNTNGYSE